MVFFTCSGCGESLKKAQVEKHRFRCRRAHLMTCIDCLKDFNGEEYQTHIKCVSEDQKYGGQNYQRKENKGEVKQEKWCELVQSAVGHLSTSNADRRLKAVFDKLGNYANVPRKQAKFANFLRSSARILDEELIERAWAAISSCAEECKQAQAKLKEQEETKKAEKAAVIDKAAQLKNDEPSCAVAPATEISNGSAVEATPTDQSAVEATPTDQSTVEATPTDQSEIGESIAKVSLKNFVKRSLAQSEDGELSLKRMKKMAAKEMDLRDQAAKDELSEKIDKFLRKNNTKYATDGKVVRFATEN